MNLPWRKRHDAARAHGELLRQQSQVIQDLQLRVLKLEAYSRGSDTVFMAVGSALQTLGQRTEAQAAVSGFVTRFAVDHRAALKRLAQDVYIGGDRADT